MHYTYSFLPFQHQNTKKKSNQQPKAWAFIHNTCISSYLWCVFESSIIYHYRALYHIHNFCSLWLSVSLPPPSAPYYFCFPITVLRTHVVPFVPFVRFEREYFFCSISVGCGSTVIGICLASGANRDSMNKFSTPGYRWHLLVR